MNCVTCGAIGIDASHRCGGPGLYPTGSMLGPSSTELQLRFSERPVPYMGAMVTPKDFECYRCAAQIAEELYASADRWRSDRDGRWIGWNEQEVADIIAKRLSPIREALTIADQLIAADKHLAAKRQIRDAIRMMGGQVE